MSKLNNLEHWERDIVRQKLNYNLICWDDEDAFETNHKHNIVYNKLYIGKKHTNLKTWDLEAGEEPDQYPVIVKPKVNLFGLGKDAYVATVEEEIEDRHLMMAQELCDDRHFTSDLIVNDGQILDSITFECFKNYYGSFYLFSSCKPPVFVFKYITRKVNELLKGYTGMACVEYLGANIIDFHLRPAIQYHDINSNIINNGLHYLSTGNLVKAFPEKTHCLVYRTRYDSIIEFKGQLPSLPPGVRSVTFPFRVGKPLSKNFDDETGYDDDFSYRYMFINGTDLTQCRKYGKLLRDQYLEINRI